MLLWSLCIASFIYTSVFYTEKTAGPDFPGGLRKVVPLLYIKVWPLIKQYSDAGDSAVIIMYKSLVESLSSTHEWCKPNIF